MVVERQTRWGKIIISWLEHQGSREKTWDSLESAQTCRPGGWAGEPLCVLCLAFLICCALGPLERGVGTSLVQS